MFSSMEVVSVVILVPLETSACLLPCCNAGLGPDVFVACFPGVDGKYNDGARKALNYILYGCSGNEVYQDSRNNPELEEVIITALIRTL